MWSHNNNDKNSPARGFWTPPASWRSQHSPAVAKMPMSERKERVSSPSCKRDIFHVIHKVPSGDSPYVRAKHVQLIDKDPSKAVSLFWAAINAGDRVDSALKDMAVVMKQLDRADEAIEAIKSFRHLCPYDSQESIDNVLVELYKRSGRIEEEIEMLQRKLKNIEEGIAFSGKKKKTARSQGRKIQITVEQERSRILGNLAWAYLQHCDYGLAEHYYRKGLSLEPDQNKQCNLAICLMHMNRIPEAKSLLQNVKASSGSKPMDDSYAKSFERACQILTELESHLIVKQTKQDEKVHQRSSASPTAGNLKEFASSLNGDVSGFSPDEHDRRSYWQNQSENEKSFFASSNNGSSPQTGVDNSWRRDSCFSTPGERLGFARKMKDYRFSFAETGPSSEHKKTFASPPIYTQPRRFCWGFDKQDERRMIRWGEDTSETEKENAIRNLSGELLDSTDNHTSWKGNVQENVGQRKSATDDSNTSLKCTTDFVWDQSAETVGNKYVGKDSSLKSRRKSWADIVEEEELGTDLGQSFHSWNYEEACSDENLNVNTFNHNSYQKNQLGSICQKLEASMDAVSSRNCTARRSLSYESAEDVNTKRKNRLQVFRDITPTPDSP